MCVANSNENCFPAHCLWGNSPSHPWFPLACPRKWVVAVLFAFPPSPFLCAVNIQRTCVAMPHFVGWVWAPLWVLGRFLSFPLPISYLTPLPPLLQMVHSGRLQVNGIVQLVEFVCSDVQGRK